MELIVKNVVVIRCHGDAKGNGFAICGFHEVLVSPSNDT